MKALGFSIPRLLRNLGLGARSGGALTRLAVTQTRFFDISGSQTDPEILVVRMRPEHGGRCDLQCSFCFEKTAPRFRILPSGARFGRVRRDLAENLQDRTEPHVILRGEDILGYGDVLGLVEVIEGCGRRVTIRTPGHRLADVQTYRSFAGRAVVFELTFFSHDPTISARMSGRSAMHGDLCRALGNLAREGIEHIVSMVVTKDNAHGLADTCTFLVREFGLPHIHLALFRTPDRRKLARRSIANGVYQHPSFRTVNEQLERLPALLPSDRNLELTVAGLPACQLSDGLAGQTRFSLHLAPPTITSPWTVTSACERCIARTGCGRIDVHCTWGLLFRQPDPEEAARLTAGLSRDQARYDFVRSVRKAVTQNGQPGDILAVLDPGRGALQAAVWDGDRVHPVGTTGPEGEASTLESFLHRGERALLVRPTEPVDVIEAARVLHPPPVRRGRTARSQAGGRASARDGASRVRALEQIGHVLLDCSIPPR